MSKMVDTPIDFIARMPPRKRLLFLASHLESTCAAGLPITGPDILLIAQRLRDLSQEMAPEKSAKVLRLVSSKGITCH